MEISYLKEFVELAKNCKFQETAEALFISQSTLSKHIQAIEKELGAELFVRTTRRAELSETGRAFLPYAVQISQLQQAYTRDLINTDVTRRIKIGTDFSISTRQIEKFMASYITTHRNIEFEMLTPERNTLRNHLRSGELDLAILCRDLSDIDSEFFSYPYYSDTLGAIVSKENPLYHCERTTIAELRKYPFVQQGTINFAQYLDPTIPPSKYKTDRRSLITQIINETNAVGIAPTNAALSVTTNDLAKDLHIIKIVPSTMIHVDLLCLKMKASTPLIQSVIEHLKHSEELLIKENNIDIYSSSLR